MPIGIGFSSGDGMDAAILPPREHACKLISVTQTMGTAYGSTEQVAQLKWVFEAINWKSPEDKVGIISLWTGLNYGNTKAKMTALLDQFFGRSLSESEAARLDVEKLVGAVKGYVTVVPHKKQDGTMTSRFGGFRWPDAKEPPQTSEFFADGAAVSNPQTSRPVPPRQVSAPKDDDFGDLDDIEDPFANEGN